ncbi:MAG: hypothetical protein PHG84_07360 [Endomicrobiaceae bacterium]|nr:hypothetical protein [Endomicrobiaceae bacterium]
MADDLIKGEWSKSKFLDMMKEYPEKIAKINDETVKVLNEQLNSCDEVNLFKEEISKKKLISSKEYELNKNILFAYDTGVTVSQPITLSHDHNLLSADEEVQSDVEELGYNVPNTIEQPKLKVGKTIWKGIKHFAKSFLREGWNADITDFFDGTVRELSDFTMLVGETYDKDSRFRNNFDGVFSKVIGNSDSQYSNIINNIVDKCIISKVIEKTEDISSKEPAPSLGPEHDVESGFGTLPNSSDEEDEGDDLDGINLDSSKKIFDKLNEIKPLLSLDVDTEKNIISKDPNNPGYYKFNFNPIDKYSINDMISIKKYNVIINFTDYLINKWKKGALFSQMTKNSKAVNYPKILTNFINNINYIIQQEPDEVNKSMKTVLLYKEMKETDQLDKALAFMLYVIYLAKANFDQYRYTNKNVTRNINIKLLKGMYKSLGEMVNKSDSKILLYDNNNLTIKINNTLEYNIINWDKFIDNSTTLINEDDKLYKFLTELSNADTPTEITNIKSYENIFEEFLTDNKNIKDYKYIVLDTKTEVK